MPAVTSRLHGLSALGQSVWIDFLSRDLIESGALARAIDEDAVVGVTSNPTIFAKALSRAAKRTTSRSRASARRRQAASSSSLAMRDVATACDLLRPLWERREGRRRLRLDRGRPEPRRRHGRARSRKRPLARSDRRAEPARQDPGDRRRRAGDRGDDRARALDQRHPDLLAQPPSPGGRGLPARARTARRLAAATRAASTRSPASSSRASTPRPTAASTKPVAQTSRGASASPTRSSPTSSTRRPFRGERWDDLAARGATRSAASGRRRR